MAALDDRLVDAAFDRSGYICDLSVHEAGRRRGIGRALVRGGHAPQTAWSG